MPVDVKICGLNDPAAVDAAVAGGARLTGFVFYGPSPRNLAASQAAALIARVPAGITRVGLFVDADDTAIGNVLDAAPLDLLQLHGAETPERIAEVKAMTGLEVMKVIKLSEASDLDAARAFENAADRLLFDAKPPAHMTDVLPGGNALAFDWALLADHRGQIPWMLAGGLTAGNIAQAVKISGARALDVSSGVEDAPGVKNIGKIKAFLTAAAEI